MRQVSLRRWVFGIAAIVLPAIASAGPPFVTDDPEPVPYKHWEFYFAGQFAHARDGDSAAAPQIEINYGALPDLQLHLIAPMAYDRPKGGSAHYGYGDTELGAKYRFIHESKHIPQVGVFPLIELPTGNEDLGLGNGEVQVFLPIWAQKSFDKWTIYGGGGWFYNPGDDHQNFGRFGMVLQRQVLPNWAIGGEIFHETADTVGAGGHTAFNIGTIYDIDDHRHLMLSVGRDIDGPNEFTCYAAFQLTF